MYDKYLRLKLSGLGWDIDPEADLAYLDLRNALAEVLRCNEHFVDVLKSVELVVCTELDDLHSIEDRETSCFLRR